MLGSNIQAAKKPGYGLSIVKKIVDTNIYCKYKHVQKYWCTLTITGTH